MLVGVDYKSLLFQTSTLVAVVLGYSVEVMTKILRFDNQTPIHGVNTKNSMLIVDHCSVLYSSILALISGFLCSFKGSWAKCVLWSLPDC